MSTYAASITVRLRESDVAALDQAATRGDCSRSDALRALLASPLPTGTTAADAIADLVRRMDTAEAERGAYRHEAEQARQDAEQRVRDLQAEMARREAGFVNAMWRALGQPPGTDRQLLAAVAGLAAGAKSVAWLRSMVATSSRDWGLADGDALIYGVLVGWEEALDVVAERHGWGPETRAAVERRRAALAGSASTGQAART